MDFSVHLGIFACTYVIRVKNLIVEVDAKYIKRKLNEPEL